jgi:hypothetical protein
MTIVGCVAVVADFVFGGSRYRQRPPAVVEFDAENEEAEDG